MCTCCCIDYIDLHISNEWVHIRVAVSGARARGREELHLDQDVLQGRVGRVGERLRVVALRVDLDPPEGLQQLADVLDHRYLLRVLYM